ncbi:MAG: hypothetical protein JXD21_00150 [Candidatus Omnitrophica bacterium]|nr:hypothetical protein [Candidatus Omnitrophota bacterium]
MNSNLSFHSLQWNACAVLHKRIKSFCEGYRQNVALVGKDREGIHYLLEHYVLPRRYQGLVYICVDASYSEQYDIFRNIAYSLLSQLSGKEDTLDALIQDADREGKLAQTTAQIKDILKRKKCTAKDLTNLLTSFIEESSSRCILIVEEFSAMAEIFGDFFDELAKFILLQKMCMVVLTSSRMKEAERILGAELNLLFGNFEVVNMEKVSLIDGYLYFTDCIKPLTIPHYCIAFFVHLVQSNMAYYPAFTAKVKNTSVSDYEEMMRSVICDTLYERDSVFFQKFSNRIDILKEKYPRDFRGLLKILALMSKGYIRKHDLVFFSGQEKRKCVGNLSKLLEPGYIEACGNIYRITDSLFSFWLAHIFPLYLSCHRLDKEKRLHYFESAVNEELLIFKEDFYKGRIQRILELFSLFKNDTVTMDTQKIKFPLLRRTKLVNYPQEKLDLLVGEGDELVFVGIKEEETQDSDILNFLNKTDAVRTKNMKKIFISLGDMNASARLIAKESKVALWDRHELNTLFQIYNKPVLV